jgi:hypothetical protein
MDVYAERPPSRVAQVQLKSFALNLALALRLDDRCFKPVNVTPAARHVAA